MRSRLTAAALATALVAVPTVVLASSSSASTAPAAKIKATKYKMLLTFDQRGSFAAGTRIKDSSRHRHGGVVMTAPPARVTKSKGVGKHSHAANFPNRGRAVIEVKDGKGLDPGKRSFIFGATLRLTRSQAVFGSNVMQKGYFKTEGGQYKLQLDPGGIPSCVFFGSASRVKVTSAVGIANNKWHRVACVRGTTGLTVRVDGKRRGFVPGQVGFISNEAPIRIGAKKLNAPNKQYRGVLDNANLRFLPTR